MKNVTVSVPDEVYHAARVRAAERGRSLSALVADYLRSLAGAEDTFARLEDQQRQVVAEITHFRASGGLDRDALHDRAVR